MAAHQSAGLLRRTSRRGNSRWRRRRSSQSWRSGGRSRGRTGAAGLAGEVSSCSRSDAYVLGCPAAAPPRASSSRQRSRGRSRRSRSSNHRGAGDFHHPGLIASRLFALLVEGPTRRSTDLSFRVPPAWRAHFLYHWRVEPGARTAPILGHRVVRVRRYPARSLKPLLPAWRQASSARDSALSMEAEPARTRRGS